jgi:hypothetical protein
MLAAITCAIALASAIAADQTRVALVIGNAAYRESPLKNPVNDARAMATVLKQLGFKVISRENATKQQMERAVAEFGQALTPGSVALFYYAGHGIQVNGHNFLVPVDAEITSEQVVRLESLDTDAVIDQLAASGSDVNLVILDACRNNPFERRFRSQGGGLAQIDAPKGTLIAYATAPGRVAADGSGSNGLYTAKLVEAINTSGIPIEEMFKRVRIAVSRETGDEQTPWEASSLVGDFYFGGPTNVVLNAPTDRDALHWESVKDSSEPQLLQTYLDQYPEGAFASLAKAKLAALRRGAPAPASTHTAAFDGVWIGTFTCGPVPGTQFAGWTDGNRSFAIKQGRVAGVTRWRQKEDGATGTATYTGTVDEAGQVTIVGLGIQDAGEKTYRIYYRGSIENGKLTAEGKQGARACTLAFHLAPVPASAAADPAPAALPDAAATDGTWQGLYKCGPNDQNMAAFEDTGRVFTIKDGRLSGERRWKRADDGATGSELFSGLIGDDGQALIVGYGLPDEGRAYRIYHHGVLSNGHLTAVGKHGTRDCTLDYLLVQSQ